MKPLYDEKNVHPFCEGVTYDKVKEIFTNNVAVTILNDGEPKTLRHRLQEYEDLLAMHGFETKCR